MNHGGRESHREMAIVTLVVGADERAEAENIIGSELCLLLALKFYAYRFGENETPDC
jgi:hypothetical protein